MIVGGKQVMGSAGDVFDTGHNVADGKYVGNSLSDAQLAVGAFKDALIQMSSSSMPQIDANALAYYFGGVHVPRQILNWASNSTLHTLTSGGMSFSCNMDAMSHVNKGAVGLRIAYVSSG